MNTQTHEQIGRQTHKHTYRLQATQQTRTC